MKQKRQCLYLSLDMGRKGWSQSETGGSRGWCGRRLLCALPHPKRQRAGGFSFHLNPSESRRAWAVSCRQPNPQARGRLLQQQVWKDACQGVKLPSCNCGAIAGVLWPDLSKGACHLQRTQVRACVETSAGVRAEQGVRYRKGSMKGGSDTPTRVTLMRESAFEPHHLGTPRPADACPDH